MPRQDNEKFSNRLETAAKARAEMLAKAKARAESAKANFEAKASERMAIATAREERAKQRAEEKRLAIITAEKRRQEEEELRRQAEIEAKAQAEREHQARIAAQEAWKPNRRPAATRGMPPARPRRKRAAKGTSVESARMGEVPAPKMSRSDLGFCRTKTIRVEPRLPFMSDAARVPFCPGPIFQPSSEGAWRSWKTRLSSIRPRKSAWCAGWDRR
jgi:hypothetical protein